MADTHSQATHRYLPISLLIAGISMVVISWTSVGKLATDAVWTPEDAEIYSRLVEENHRLSYRSAERSGLSEDEFDSNRNRVQGNLESMIDKLEYAKSQPAVWSRYLFWTGTVLASLGAATHYFGRTRNSSATDRI